MILIAVVFYMAAIFLYTTNFVKNGIKLNELLYMSLYLQCAVFSGILYFKIKSALLRAFLLINFTNFVLLIIDYFYVIVHGAFMFKIMLISLIIGTILSLIVILWNFLLSR